MCWNKHEILITKDWKSICFKKYSNNLYVIFCYIVWEGRGNYISIPLFTHRTFTFSHKLANGNKYEVGGKTIFQYFSNWSLRLLGERNTVVRERNYDIGNRELLAVKLASEEWHHWLEGAGVPFIVWTNHKNHELTPGKPSRLCFSVVLKFPSLIVRTSIPMPYAVFLIHPSVQFSPLPSYLKVLRWALWCGKLNRRSVG